MVPSVLDCGMMIIYLLLALAVFVTTPLLLTFAAYHISIRIEKYFGA